MSATSGRTGARALALLTIIGIGIAATGCGRPARPAPGGARKQRTAIVTAPDSLQALTGSLLGQAFARSTGYAYRLRPAGGQPSAGGSDGGRPNVIETIGQPVGPGRGNWSVRYAATALVIAYNPAARYGPQLTAIAHGTAALPRLFSLLTKPGFRLGRADPNADPLGLAFIEMLELAQRAYHLPAREVARILRGPAAAASSPQIFSAGTLVPRLKSGELDAISAYRAQAVALHLRYIPLPPGISLGDPARGRHYRTVSVRLAGGIVRTGQPLVVSITTAGRPSPAATAFVTFTLSAGGLVLYRQAGFRIITPTAEGDAGAIPGPIRDELGSPWPGQGRSRPGR